MCMCLCAHTHTHTHTHMEHYRSGQQLHVLLTHEPEGCLDADHTVTNIWTQCKVRYMRVLLRRLSVDGTASNKENHVVVAHACVYVFSRQADGWFRRHKEIWGIILCLNYTMGTQNWHIWRSCKYSNRQPWERHGLGEMSAVISLRILDAGVMLLLQRFFCLHRFVCRGLKNKVFSAPGHFDTCCCSLLRWFGMHMYD